ncbi:universal stress protein, partial [Morganella morganii]|uniref:universal stress protein n=1 Tax=Morganella morganii TaxID=582 RepID=UPI00046A9C57
ATFGVLVLILYLQPEYIFGLFFRWHTILTIMAFQTEEITMHSTILVPVDPKQMILAETIISELHDYSDKLGIHFYFLTVLPSIDEYYDDGDIYPKSTEKLESDTERADMAEKKLMDIVKNIQIPDERKHLIIKIGNANDDIIRASREIKADLIIIGARHPSFKTHILGSTASFLAKYAEISVFIVR